MIALMYLTLIRLQSMDLGKEMRKKKTSIEM